MRYRRTALNARLTIGLIGAAALLSPVPADAQSTRWVVDTALSLAWWQVTPHLNHLWATTCPADPSWRPGEDRGSGWSVPDMRLPRGYAAIGDTVVPLFPRRWALPICPGGLTGEISTADTIRWTGTRGLLVLNPNTLVTGLQMRDEYAQKAILDTPRFPDIRFYIDSLTDLHPGDTLRATVVGVFEFRGVKQSMSATARAWREAGGLRVTARFDILPHDLITVYGISRVSLGLGVGSLIWKNIHLGIDAILKQPEKS